MAGKSKSAKLERKKLFSDPVMIGMIAVLLIFLTLFIVYPLFVLMIDSIYTEGKLTLSVFQRVLNIQFPYCVFQYHCSWIPDRNSFDNNRTSFCLCGCLRKGEK